MQQLWGANEDSSQRIGEPGRAGPDRSVTCQGGGGEDGEDGRAGRDKERGGGRHTQAGEGETTDEWLPERPSPPELLLRRRLNGVPRGGRPFGEHKARLRPLPPPIPSLGALSLHYPE